MFSTLKSEGPKVKCSQARVSKQAATTFSRMEPLLLNLVRTVVWFRSTSFRRHFHNFLKNSSLFTGASLVLNSQGNLKSWNLSTVWWKPLTKEMLSTSQLSTVWHSLQTVAFSSVLTRVFQSCNPTIFLHAISPLLSPSSYNRKTLPVFSPDLQTVLLLLI